MRTYFYAFSLFIVIVLSLTEEDLIYDNSLFLNNELLQDPAVFNPDLSSGLSFFSSFDNNVDESNTDLFFAAACPSFPGDDRIEARDEDDEKPTACSSPDEGIIFHPQPLPTLDNNNLNDLGPLDTQALRGDPEAINKDFCPWYRPFYLCCICDRKVSDQFCQDCLPSKLPPPQPISSLSYQSLTYYIISTPAKIEMNVRTSIHPSPSSEKEQRE